MFAQKASLAMAVGIFLFTHGGPSAAAMQIQDATRVLNIDDAKNETRVSIHGGGVDKFGVADTNCNLMFGETLEYLDRHFVSCGIGLSLTSFKVEKGPCTGNDRRFTNECAPTPGSITTGETGCGAMDGKNLEYLDRHAVACGSGQSLAAFGVKRSGCSGNLMRISYECVALASGFSLSSVTTSYTPCNAMDGETLEFLDRHDVSCDSGKVLTSFAVVRTSCSGNQMRFSYGCASVETASPTSTPTGSPTPSPAGARDDPHATSLTGQKFDINQPGGHVLLRVPLDPARGPLLSLSATVGPDSERGMGACRLYIRRLAISGEWLGGKAVEVFAHTRNVAGWNGAGNATVRPFSMTTHLDASQMGNGTWEQFADVEAREDSTLAVSQKVSVVAKRQGGFRNLENQSLVILISGSGPPAVITVSQAFHQALNVDMTNMVGLGFPKMGGLLGTEGHASVLEEKTAACMAAIHEAAQEPPQSRVKRTLEDVAAHPMCAAKWH